MTGAFLISTVATLLAAQPAAPAAPAPAQAQVEVAELPAILAAIRAPGAQAVLVNVWATWCEPCREEMPDLVRFYRENRAQGLRMVLISADDDDRRAEVARVLGALGFDGPAFIKHGNDMTFIDALDPQWKGALPATFLFDARGAKKKSWLGSVTYDQLRARVSGLLKGKKR
jgi:thiol-disulfide isomerase/thioredoxin